MEQEPAFDSLDSFLLTLDDELPRFEQADFNARFDELTLQAINRPDDELVLSGLRTMLLEVRRSGQIDYVMQMAMTLGAMACVHPHLQGLAAEAGEGLFGQKDSGHSDDERAHHHDKENESKGGSDCKDCAPRKPCSRHK